MKPSASVMRVVALNAALVRSRVVSKPLVSSETTGRRALAIAARPEAQSRMDGHFEDWNQLFVVIDDSRRVTKQVVVVPSRRHRHHCRNNDANNHSGKP